MKSLKRFQTRVFFRRMSQKLIGQAFLPVTVTFVNMTGFRQTRMSALLLFPLFRRLTFAIDGRETDSSVSNINANGWIE
ncbi:MAG: hypothetical protein HY960_00025 [Ignavibacteriae bacterium]|nr:hypothetical protein [Ignavibacteriota bacterium]